MGKLEIKEEYIIESFSAGGISYDFVPYNKEFYDKSLKKVKEKEITEISYFTLSHGNKKYMKLTQEEFKRLGKPSKLVKKIIFKNISEK